MEKSLEKIAATPIGELALRAPVRVSSDTPLDEVVARLRQGRRGVVVVEDETGIVGIFGERDVMTRVDHSAPSWGALPVREVMTRAPQTIRADQTVEDSINLMLAGDYRHLPIVNAANELVGIVSIRDVLIHIVGFYPEDFLNLPPDPDHEARGPWGG